MRVISLFSGCGGLDLGFTNAGFEIVYANDFNIAVKETFEKNHGTVLDCRSITEVKSEEIPDADGIIGGPPCQSWSLAGAMRGVKDPRGRLFYEYIRIIKDKRPKFFLAENVPGIISKTHLPEFKKIIALMSSLGYEINYYLVDARNYGVPQERKRVIIVGYRRDLKIKFILPLPTHSIKAASTIMGIRLKKPITLRETIGDLSEPSPAKDKNKTNGTLTIPNHEYFVGSYSTIYMSRNRRRDWEEQSFTIQAGGRHAPLHPSSSKMKKADTDKMVFIDKNPVHRRLSVRESHEYKHFQMTLYFIIIM